MFTCNYENNVNKFFHIDAYHVDVAIHKLSIYRNMYII